MSNPARNVVELTLLKPFVTKSILLHIADTVRNELRFWRSIKNVAKRLGTDEKTVRRHIKLLMSDGLLTCVGEKSVKNGTAVNVYRLELAAILALPCIESEDNRAELAKDLYRGSEPRGEGLRTPGGGAESPTNHKLPINSPYKSAEKKEPHLELVESTRANAHLDDDPKLDAWVAEAKRKEGLLS